MFENVLVGVDGRSGGRDAVALARHLLAPGGKLTLAHIRSGELRPSHAVTPGLLGEERDDSARLLEAERAAAEVDAKLIGIVATSAGRGLHQQAEEQQADLIVVGTCRRGLFGRAMLGDHTRAALNGAPCAVAVAAAGYAERGTPLAKIGVGYDDSSESRAALATALELAAPTDAEVHAIEVVSLPSYAYTGMVAPVLGPSIQEMLQEARGRMKALPDAIGHAAYGLTGEEIAAFGEQMDVLVVGSRGYGPVKRMMLGSTSDYLERHARCSLVVIPRVSVSHGERPGEARVAAHA